MNFLHTLTTVTVTGASPTVGDALRRVTESSAFAMAIYTALLLLSVLTWAVVIKKILDLRNEKRLGSSFRQRFLETSGDILTLSREGIVSRNSPSRIFIAAYEELRLWTTVDQETGDLVSEKPIGPAVQRTLDRAIDAERTEWEWGVTFLATTAHISPLLGLLGTVWGVFSTFAAIDVSGSPSLKDVAPGMSEALLTTIAGLLVAVPAVVAHNAVVRRVNAIEQELEHFSGQILNSFERQVRSVDDIRAYASNRKTGGPKVKGGG